MNPIIEVQNLSKLYQIGAKEAYGSLREEIMQAVTAPFRRHTVHTSHLTPDTNLWALKDVSFEVNEGEVVGIIGRNGAGKSTLLKILSRITEPTSGRIVMRGRVASLLEVGTGFHPELTGRENIFLNGALLGMSSAEIRKKFDEIVTFSEIEKFLDTPVKRYSSGMYVRLAFAVAAHLEPEILIVDEVLAVGDAQFQKKCLGKMGEVAKGGRTVLFVSHNMPTIQNISNRVVWFQKGELKTDGEPGYIISQYLSEGLFFDQPEVNLQNHIGRSTSQELALRKAWILNGDGVKSNRIFMGGKMIISFEFSCNRKIKNPGFGFGIEDENGRRVFSLNNYITPTKENMFDSVDAGIASFNIPELPLLPGTYFISLSLVENENEWIDFVGQALVFHVLPADIFESGKIQDRTHGVVFVAGQIAVQLAQN